MNLLFKFFEVLDDVTHNFRWSFAHIGSNGVRSGAIIPPHASPPAPFRVLEADGPATTSPDGPPNRHFVASKTASTRQFSAYLKVLASSADLSDVAYKTDNQTSVTRRVRRRAVVATPAPSPVRPEIDLGQVSGANTQRTTMILQVVLAAATCLTLVGAIATLSSGGAEQIPASSPDASPPAVLIQTD